MLGNKIIAQPFSPPPNNKASLTSPSYSFCSYSSTTLSNSLFRWTSEAVQIRCTTYSVDEHY
jgi:hypothetical protein